jgi:hypothetical protein
MGNNTGRPTVYSQELANRICDRIALGESLIGICKDNGMPGRSTVHVWLAENSDFLDKYVHAREDQADYKADEIEDIADRVLKGELKPDAARVAIDAKKWTASKLKPKKYGDRVDQNIHHTGEVSFVNDVPRPKTD